MTCKVYIRNLTKDEKIQDILTSYHNQIFKRLIDSKLFNKLNDHYFLPPVGDGRYTKAQSLIAKINEEYGAPVTATTFTKAHSKEYVYVNVKNLLPKAQQELPIQGAVQGVLFQKNENAVNATLKVIGALQKSPRNKYPSNQKEGFYNDLRKQGAPESQITLLKQYIQDNNITEIDKNELIAGLSAAISYIVEIHTAKANSPYQGSSYSREDGYQPQEIVEIGDNTAHYSNMTVPGGTNYTENEIRTPDITPSIKGHAEFSTDQGIGWFRSDEPLTNNIVSNKETGELQHLGQRPDTKTRRIIELQSDLFQKGRGREGLVKDSQDVLDNPFLDDLHEKASKEVSTRLDNQFLQLLNKDNNWVTFFIKSIIQDSAKKGYEKVLFPSGNTANKVEGQQTLEDFVKIKEVRLKEVNDGITKVRVLMDTLNSISTKVDNGELMASYKKNEAGLIKEKETLEEEIQDAREGNTKFAAINHFYETTIKNILDKRGYNPTRIKDEYGNEWYEIAIKPERDLATFYFQKPDLQSSKASPKTIEKVKEWLSRVGIDVRALDLNKWHGVNGVANLLKGTIEIAEGKENVALPEEAMHFAVDMIKHSNLALYKKMFNSIGQYNAYQQVRDVYKDSPEYKLSDGSLNVPKIKEEAMGKLLAEYYIRKEELSTEKPEFLIQTKTWWEQFVDWIKGLIGIAQFNPFEQAASALPENTNTNNARIKELAELIQVQNNVKYMEDAIELHFSKGEYDVIVAAVAEQLADPATYQNTLTNMLSGDEELAKEILSSYQQLLQLAPDNNNPFADSLEKKLEDKIKDFQLRKIVDEDAVNEDDRNYYEANIEGKPKRIGRTTEWAKKKNLQHTQGKDYFADLTPEQKNYYAKQAMSGINGHFDMERIIQASLNPDGTLKPADQILINFRSATAPAIFKVLQEFLLGTPSTQGFLRQFEEGSKFRVEQQILNDKVVTTNDKGEKVRGRAGTIDLLVIQPTQGAIIYDWKFIGMSENKPQYQPLKQSQHKLQLADYKRTLKDAYGLKESEVKAFTIPIAASYQDVLNPVTKEISPILTSVKIGNVDIKTEDRPHLLPVVPDDQSTGNRHIDSLLSSLRAKYQRVYKKRVGSEEWADKTEDLNTLSSAIRNLQVAINFEPLSIEAQNFKENIQKTIDKYSTYDSKNKTTEDLSPVLQELADAINAARYYADVDEVFISEYGASDLSEKNKATLLSLQQTSSAAKSAATKIQDIIDSIISQKSKEEGVVDILTPEKEAKGTINSLLESGSVPVKSLRFLTKIAIDARSADQIEAQRILEEFGEIYEPLSKLAKSKNVLPIDLVSDASEHRLIRKVDKAVFDNIKKAKTAKDKKTILANIDVDKYKEMAQAKIKEKQEQIDGRVYSQDAAKDAAQKKAKKLDVFKSLDINRADFNGWRDRTFSYLVGQSVKEEENYSKEYKQLLTPEYKSALDMYNFITALNQRAKQDGYLDRKQGSAFLAFINATLAQRVAASSNKFATLKDSLIDMITVQEYEEQGYGKKDEETGQIDRSIPTYFTRELEKGKESRDLLAIIPLYIKALIHFETSQKLESLFQATLLLERNKGHLEKEGGKVIFQGDSPKIFAGNSVNSQKIQEYTDDQIYGINLQDDDLLSRGIGKIVSGENKEHKKVSLKKGIEASNKLVQQLAVGLKLLVAIPNYVGAHLQAVINAGNYYKGREYELNHTKIVTSSFIPGVQGDVQKALIDLIVPLNDENFHRTVKNIAWKQSARKWLSTVSFQDFMMSTNRIPDVAHELTNALTWMENTMVEEGQLVNIRQFLRQQPEYIQRYRTPSTLKQVEKDFEAKVKEYKETRSLPKIAKFNSEGLLAIPGIDVASSNISQYRTRVVEYGRYITAQLSRENKAEYRRNIIAKSFMMFKNWIVKQVQLRGLDIQKNPTLDEWEYGRTRLFAKVALTLGFRNILKMRDIIKATPKGIQIMREIYEDKVEEYYRKTGQKLEITEEEFFDLVRKELMSEAKELALILGIVGAGFAVSAAAPPDDEEDAQVKNKWKLIARAMAKSKDELLFYYNPLSAESITRGTILPSLGLLSKVEKLLEHTANEAFGDEDTRKAAHPLKYLLNLTPIAAQFQNELFPVLFPEEAKEQGIRLTEEARAFR